MNISGILVVTRPVHMSAVADALRALPGVDVYQQDPATGRIIVAQEAQSVGAEVDGFQRIRTLPNVISAQLVYHRFDQETAAASPEQPTLPLERLDPEVFAHPSEE